MKNNTECVRIFTQTNINILQQSATRRLASVKFQRICKNSNNLSLTPGYLRCLLFGNHCNTVEKVKMLILVELIRL